MNRMLRMHDVLAATGLSRSTIYLKMEKGEFPRGVKLGERAVAWPQSAVERWLQERIDAARPAASGAGVSPTAVLRP
jgi:prophage regulatory protein